MKKNIVVPEMGESISKGTIVSWRKKNGDYVKEGEELFELETDKATVLVPSTAAGIVEILVKQGADVAINQTVATIESREGDPKPNAAAATPAAAPIIAPPSPAAPLVAETVKTKTIVSPAPGPAPATSPQTRVPMTPLRKRTAERLVQARRESVQVTTFNEIDMSKVMDIRSHYQEAFEKEHGIKIGFMSFFVKACCKALQIHPELNAQVDKDEIVYNNFYNIGVAISIDRGLIVPVVRDADRLTFAEIEKTVAGLAKRARDKLLTPDELLGGTFTITNGGVFGSLMSTPVPAYPQAAILGMHAIKKRPVVADETIVIRPMMYVALTYDHRIIDGREAIGFLVKVKDFIEGPDTLLLEM